MVRIWYNLEFFFPYTITVLVTTGRNLCEPAAQFTQLCIYRRNEDSKLAELLGQYRYKMWLRNYNCDNNKWTVLETSSNR